MAISEKAEKIIHDIPGRYYTIELDWKEVLAPITDYIAALESENERLKEDRRWIPVSERLPKENAPVLVLTVLGGMFVDFIHGKSVVTGNPDFYELDVEDVTHWMPLPEPPIVYGKVCEE